MHHLDDTEAQTIKARFQVASKTLNEMAEKVGEARQIRDFSSDRRKNLLAKYMLIPGAADSKEAMSARSNPTYLKEFEELSQQHKDAETTLAKYAGVQASFEAARSLLSWNRESLRQLEG